MKYISKHALIIISNIMLISMLLTACGSGQTSTSSDKEEVTNQQTDIEEEAEQPTTIEEATEVEEKSTPEPTAEPTPEPTEEPKQAASLEEYIAQLDPNEICVVVWNEDTNRQEKLTNGQKCVVKSGDRVIVPILNNDIKSVYYGQAYQEYNEDGYYEVIVDSNKPQSLFVGYEENGEFKNIQLPAAKIED